MKPPTGYSSLLARLALILLCCGRAVPQANECISISSSALEKITSGPRAELGPAPSPDGKWVAFEYFHPGPGIIPQIWIMDRVLGPESVRPIVDDQNYNSWPSWSPDSKWISFVSHGVREHTIQTGQVYKVKIEDRTVVQLTHFREGTVLRDSTSWARDGRVAFVYNDGIYAVRGSGGDPEELIDTRQTLSPGSLWGAVWSPDGSRLAFKGNSLGSEEADQRIWVADSNGRHMFYVTKGSTDDVPSWLDNDHILFERWSKSGEVRICVVSLSTLRIQYLTRNHIDQTPAADPTGRVLFFARADLSKKNIYAWLPETHIWAVPILRVAGR